jgi:glycogen debranching enzyme
LQAAATKPPVGRFVLLSKLEEAFFFAGQAFDLSANRHPGVVHPQGFRYLKQFRLDPFPVFTFEIEGIEIEKSVFMRAARPSGTQPLTKGPLRHPASSKPPRLHLQASRSRA